MQRIALVFFRTEAGNEPVRDWLKELPQRDRWAVGQDLERVQYRWPVGIGALARRRPLGSAYDTRQQPCGACHLLLSWDVLVALNGFIKKTRKTPQGELDLARDRMKELSR